MSNRSFTMLLHLRTNSALPNFLICHATCQMIKLLQEVAKNRNFLEMSFMFMDYFFFKFLMKLVFWRRIEHSISFLNDHLIIRNLQKTWHKEHKYCRAADIPCKSTFNCQPGKVDLEEPAQEMQGWRGGLKDAKILSELLKETRWKELLYPTLLCTTRYYSVLTGTVLYMHVKDKHSTVIKRNFSISWDIQASSWMLSNLN